jgi:hypothetical protein
MEWTGGVSMMDLGSLAAGIEMVVAASRFFVRWLLLTDLLFVFVVNARGSIDSGSSRSRPKGAVGLMVLADLSVATSPSRSGRPPSWVSMAHRPHPHEGVPLPALKRRELIKLSTPAASSREHPHRSRPERTWQNRTWTIPAPAR